MTKEEQVLLIVQLLNEGKSFTQISKQVGVSTTCISNIKSGHRWSSLTGIKKVAKPPRTRLTQEQVNQIREMASEGRRLSFIGRKFGQHYKQIHQIVSGKRWK